MTEEHRARTLLRNPWPGGEESDLIFEDRVVVTAIRQEIKGIDNAVNMNTSTQIEKAIKPSVRMVGSKTDALNFFIFEELISSGLHCLPMFAAARDVCATPQYWVNDENAHPSGKG
nr:hypothetical protein Iba_chr09cCG1180 [Ipomoea batatas]